MTTLLDDSVNLNGAGERASLPSLLGELTGQLVSLGRQEIRLAKAELSANAKAGLRDGAGMMAGAVIIHAGLLALCAALAAGLALVMPLWASLLTVGVILILGGGLAFQLGMSKMKEDVQLEHLPKSLERNVEFLKEKISS